MFVEGRDAAFASGIGSGWQGPVGGYVGGPNAYHVWSPSDWELFADNRKLPIWVGGTNGTAEGPACVSALQALSVPIGTHVCLDMETRSDAAYVNEIGKILQDVGYLVLVYGSRSSVFGNPQLNGYWVADWTGQEHMAVNPSTGDSIGIRGTQWTSGHNYDTTAWKQWVLQTFWK